MQGIIKKTAIPIERITLIEERGQNTFDASGIDTIGNTTITMLNEFEDMIVTVPIEEQFGQVVDSLEHYKYAIDPHCVLLFNYGVQMHFRGSLPTLQRVLCKGGVNPQRRK